NDSVVDRRTVIDDSPAAARRARTSAVDDDRRCARAEGVPRRRRRSCVPLLRRVEPEQRELAAGGGPGQRHLELLSIPDDVRGTATLHAEREVQFLIVRTLHHGGTLRTRRKSLHFLGVLRAGW